MASLNHVCGVFKVSRVAVVAGGGADGGAREQRGTARGSERTHREAALPADPGGGAGEPPQAGQNHHDERGRMGDLLKTLLLFTA